MRPLLALLFAALPSAAQTGVTLSRPVAPPALPTVAVPALLPTAPALSAPTLAVALPAPSVLPAMAMPMAIPKAAPAAASPMAAVAALAAEAKSAAGGGAFQRSAGAFFDAGARHGSGADAVAAFSAPNAVAAPGLEAPQFRGDLTGSQGAESVPGSIFDFKPVDKSPDHGFPALDRFVRRVFGAPDTRFSRGFQYANVADRSQARVFLYGEKHTDTGLVAKNMAALASDMRPGRPAVILVEGYVGRDLRGHEALQFMERRGFDPTSVPEGTEVEVRGWEDPVVYDETTPYVLRHHMEDLAMNMLLNSEARGFPYYAKLARQAVRYGASWVGMRRAAIGRRNGAMDRALAEALAAADASGATVHLVAGAEHLVARPALVDYPLVGGFRVRGDLARVLGSRPYWAGKPADSR